MGEEVLPLLPLKHVHSQWSEQASMDRSQWCTLAFFILSHTYVTKRWFSHWVTKHVQARGLRDVSSERRRFLIHLFRFLFGGGRELSRGPPRSDIHGFTTLATCPESSVSKERNWRATFCEGALCDVVMSMGVQLRHGRTCCSQPSCFLCVICRRIPPPKVLPTSVSRASFWHRKRQRRRNG